MRPLHEKSGNFWARTDSVAQTTTFKPIVKHMAQHTHTQVFQMPGIVTASVRYKLNVCSQDIDIGHATQQYSLEGGASVGVQA